MADDAPTSSPPALPSPLSYRGRMGRLGYFIGIAIAGLVLAGAFMALVHASTPTATGDTAPLVFMLLPVFFWIHSLVTVKRLRDAGLPAWHYVFYLFGPFAWLALVGQAKSLPLMLVGFTGIFVLPVFFKSKPEPTADAPAA